MNIQAVARAVSLARGEGYPIDVLTTVVQNAQGPTIFWAEEPVRDEIPPEQIPTFQVNNRVTEDFVKEELELYGLILEDMVISPNQSGDQLLTIKLSALDIVTANQAIPSFMPSLQAMFHAEDNFNKRHNTQITTVIVQLAEKGSGKNLLNYSLDVVTGRETWTMADELTKDWFPHPPK